MPDNQEPTELLLREIEPGDRVTGLSLGNQKYVGLKIFLKKCAKDYHSSNVAKTYVVVDLDSPPKVWAYMSLVCSSIKLDFDEHPDDVDGYSYSDFPAVKIARLAVDSRIIDKGVGSQMIQFAISMARDKIMPQIGCRYLVADSKEDAVTYYTDKHGFSVLKANNGKFSLFLRLIEYLKCHVFKRAKRYPIVYLDLNNL